MNNELLLIEIIDNQRQAINLLIDAIDVHSYPVDKADDVAKGQRFIDEANQIIKELNIKLSIYKNRLVLK
jgi:hypothetical protein